MNALLQIHHGGQDPMPSLFEKRAIVELSSDEMMAIDGGTTPVCLIALASSVECGMIVLITIDIAVGN